MTHLGIGPSSVSGTSSDSFTFPRTQLQKTVELLEKEFPRASANGARARVVFEAFPKGGALTSNLKDAEPLVAKLQKAP
ncbi:hypothetical protein [Streptomyces ipomoeae]|uniref:hypothetical protein n=1 Tax=Streptomyces ipomoeae TaxID=103232 RepID=UPI0011471E20|nr:hypothetical protein [Streptomyces ipomoeae]MDX2939111.1 hypothetical protein [Streptomyces ipomoeae]TQE30410.1 hypothetical protein SipoB123_04550 [Streptomyces ipomoeae]